MVHFDERYTSCKSACCRGYKMKPMYDNNKPFVLPNGTQVARKIHGVSICQGCGTLWSRDDNAARNIFEGTWQQLGGEPRPYWLTTSETKPDGWKAELQRLRAWARSPG